MGWGPMFSNSGGSGGGSSSSFRTGRIAPLLMSLWMLETDSWTILGFFVSSQPLRKVCRMSGVAAMPTA